MPKSASARAKNLYAISLKQPWATLLVHGLKTVEVRRWQTARRGRVFIHASRTADARSEAWKLVPPELKASARLVGGIVGSAELTDCIAYRTVDSFRVDQPRHLNDPTWFVGPVLYGFAFRNTVALPFRPLSGWVRFFPVTLEG
jgi:hypothetical protein